MTLLNSILSYLNPKSAIYVVNEATVVSDAEVKGWCKAVQLQIKRDVAPVWGKPAKSVKFLSSFGTGLQGPAAKAPKNAWVIAVLDDADQAGALGYHSTDDHGRVYGRVFAKTAMQYDYSPSQTFSHEVLETWGDPGVDEWVDTGHGVDVPVELCDAVEGDSYHIGTVEVSNFVTPAWFGRLNSGGVSSALTDHLGTTGGQPFHLAPKGYTVRRYPDGTTNQIFGQEYNVEYGGAKSHALGRGVRRGGYR